jgi:large conductance mechanosensitive channel
MGFVQEFRDFAIKGNVFDLAIGVIMGGAFGKIVTALIDHLINPILGLAGGVNFTEMYLTISKGKGFVDGMKYADAKSAGVVLGYGAFITETINFIIMAFVVFVMVKMYTAAKKRFEDEKPAPAPAPAGPSEKDYLKEIRDLLAKK